MPSPNRAIVVNRNNFYSFVTKNSSGVITGQGSNVSMGSSVLLRDNLTTTSVRTPNFRGIKPRDLPVNPYYKYSLYKYEGGGNFQQTARNVSNGTVTTYVYDVNLDGFALTIANDASTDAEELTQKLVSKLISEISLKKADAAVSIAELGKTAQHLAHTATRVYGALNGLRTGRFSDFAKALGLTYTTRDVLIYKRRYNEAFDFDRKRRKSTKRMYVSRSQSRVTDLAADTWLEYTYAWKPLLSDLYANAEATASLVVGAGSAWRYCTVRATSERESFKETVRGQTRVRDRKVSRRWGAMGVQFRIPDGSLNIATAFGLNNPLTVAWELVPFSFVVDWFLPLGNAIASLTAFSGLEFKSGWKSTRHFRLNTRELLPGPAYTTGGVQYTVLKSNVKGSQTEHGQERSVLSSFPSFGFPKWKDPRSFAHAASAVSLLQSLFLRK